MKNSKCFYDDDDDGDDDNENRRILKKQWHDWQFILKFRNIFFCHFDFCDFSKFFFYF